MFLQAHVATRAAEEVLLVRNCTIPKLFRLIIVSMLVSKRSIICDTFDQIPNFMLLRSIIQVHLFCRVVVFLFLMLTTVVMFSWSFMWLWHVVPCHVEAVHALELVFSVALQKNPFFP